MMDKRILAFEESHFRSNSVASSSRSSGLVKANSIEIDLNRPAEEEIDTPDVNEQFSMRGFVAGMRKKDISVCYPFNTSQTAGMANLEKSLPPLHTPSFRWWQCSSCVPNKAVDRSTLAMVVAERIDDTVASASHNRGKNGLSSQNYIGNKEKSVCQDARRDTSRAKLFGNNRRNHNSADAFDVLTIAERSFSKGNEPANAASPSDGTVNPLPRRRKPKLRTLADIVMEERNPLTENRRPKSDSSSRLQATSMDTELALRNFEIAQGIKTPRPKRKFVFEEKTTPQGKFNPSCSLKRFKGQTSQRIESSSLESRGDALAKMNVEYWSKSGSTNGKKRKAIDVGKKVRKNQTGSEKVARKEFQKSSFMGSGSFKKQDASYGPRGMVSSFKNSLSGKQSETDFGLSKSKRLENEASCNLSMPPKKSNVGDVSDKGKAALDLLVNCFASYERNSSSRPEGNIPDLNETITHNSSAMSGKQLSSVSENILPISKNLANSTVLPSFSNGSHKGKTVSDIKGNEDNRMMNGPFMPREEQNWPNPTSVGGLDPYSKDAAMQLLSLMDQRTPSGSSLKIGPSENFMNKTFTPCSNHPPLNRNQNQNVFNGLFVSQNSQYKDLLQSCYGVSPVGEKNSSSYLHRPIAYEQGSAKGEQMAGPSSIAIEKATSKSPLRICTLNHNPADFSHPDERNEFTISSKDLKFRKRSDAKGKLHSVNVGAQKKQRPRKAAPGKEYQANS